MRHIGTKKDCLKYLKSNIYPILPKENKYQKTTKWLKNFIPYKKGFIENCELNCLQL